MKSLPDLRELTMVVVICMFRMLIKIVKQVTRWEFQRKYL